ncbi:MAG TPA: amidohydrolase [Bacteroidota bacterium]|nr:amidohydrolase [Bacteroidota bacterium]
MSTQLRVFLSLLGAFVVALYLFFVGTPLEVDTLYVNGKIYTMDNDNTVVDALAVRGEWIAAVGSRSDLEQRVRFRRVVDLAGKTVLPGFIDGHAHLLSLGLARLTLDLVGTQSEQEVVARVRARVATSEPGQWVRGRGWDQNLWPKKRFPTTSALDAVSPENPVYLTRIDGHAVWVNRRALEIAGVTSETPDPPGGRILRDSKGNPTGVFIDAAMQLITDHLPSLSEKEAEQALELAIQECLSYGLTSVHDMGVSNSEIKLYRRLIDEGRFPFRVYAAVDGEGETWNTVLQTGALVNYRRKLSVRAIKLYIDGALGSRGAALIEPYSDDPANRGLTLMSDEDLKRVVGDALNGGFQVCTHAIGDRGNNIVLNAYEAALRENRVKDHRLRIEHAQVLHPNDIPRFSQLGVIPSMQPTHCTSDMFWAESRLGPERVHGAYAWRSLLNTGVIICGGSDFPVEHPNPLAGIYAAITRRDQRGIPRNADDVKRFFQLSEHGIVDPKAFDGGWYPDQRMNRVEAIRAFTSWAAFAAFEEELKGTLKRGKLADFLILSHDPFEVSGELLLTTRVETTILGGEVVYQLEEVRSASSSQIR